MNNIIYLENFVESTAGLPPELTRILANVKDLDERSMELADKIRHNFDACMAKASQYTRKAGSDAANEVAELRRGILEDQRVWVQWADEKISLACIMVDLVDMHMAQLDKDLGALEDELNGVETVDSDMLDLYDLPLEEVPMPKRQASAVVKAEELPVLPQTAAGQIKPAASGMAPFFPASPTHMQQGRRERIEGVSALSHNGSRGAIDGGEGTSGGDAEIEMYTPVIPPGMQTSAPTPQAVGRLLTYADINEGLRGHRAELFWPVDSLWYLIEIRDVDLNTQRASVMYVTGEREDLELTDIVREGHMSLITSMI